MDHQAKEDEIVWEYSMHSSDALSVQSFFFLGSRDSMAHMVTKIYPGRSGVRTPVPERRSEKACDSPSLLFHK